MLSAEPTLSPTRVVAVARRLLLAGRGREALRLLGIVQSACDEYPSFYIVLGECLLAEGKISDARLALQHALQLTPNSARPAILLESFDAEPEPASSIVFESTPKRSQQDRAEQKRAERELTGQTHPEQTLAALFDDVPRVHSQRKKREDIHQSHETKQRGSQPDAQSHSEVHPEPDIAQQPNAFDLGRVAGMLTRDRPIVRPTSYTTRDQPVGHEKESGDSTLVSETLAGILLGQGNFEEALLAYRQLRKEEPKRGTYFDERIKLIEERLKSSSARI